MENDVITGLKYAIIQGIPERAVAAAKRVVELQIDPVEDFVLSLAFLKLEKDSPRVIYFYRIWFSLPKR